MALQGEYAPSPSDWVREQVEAFEASGGTAANTLRDTGYPIVVITNLGAKSGKVRKTPVMRIEKDGRYLAVASKGGGPEDPLWTNNFRAHPEVELQDGTVKASFVARELTGAEYDEWYAEAERQWPTYIDYKKRAAGFDRIIPIFLLEQKD
ncbi:nitroreductase family deazaflavin-dependent oxidoreductase [Nocardioides sp.]|uniref:nitroreductase family deazaflavin-dependent oxidoreductase n=1 Tax=Nocardioides sp. TaxID=35761 RepID=UPI0039E4FED9